MEAAEAEVKEELEGAKRASTSKLYVLSSRNSAVATGVAATVSITMQNSKATLPVGSRGVLVSCIGGKEQYAAKDSIRILTEVVLSNSAMHYRPLTVIAAAFLHSYLGPVVLRQAEGNRTACSPRHIIQACRYQQCHC